MSALSFIIPGRVGGKGRGRALVSKKTGRAFVYTPEKTRSTEAMVRTLAAEAMGSRPLFTGPLILDVTVTLNTPASWSKKRKAAAFYVTGKPDADNSIKLLGDSCNGIIWHDDSQLCEVHFRRRYNDAVAESVEVRIEGAQDLLFEALRERQAAE